MKKHMIFLTVNLILLLCAMLQGCAQTGGVQSNERELYQPTNTTNEQEQYIRAQRSIYN